MKNIEEIKNQTYALIDDLKKDYHRERTRW